MFEIIFKAPNEDFFKSEAARLGFMDPNGNVITNGTFASGGGWAMALPGTVYEPVTPPEDPEGPWPEPVAREGYFGRLRINGTPETMPSFAPEIVQYTWSETLGGWTDDGVTLAPDWVGDIGIML